MNRLAAAICTPLIFLMIVSMTAQNNEWAPIGATWYYNNMSSFFQGPFEEYITFTAVRDTTIAGDTARVVLERRHELGGVVRSTKTIVMKQDSGRVYFWYDQLEAFQLIYDFSAEVGDTVEVFCRQAYDGSSITIIVDSTDVVDVNGRLLRRHFFSQPETQVCEYIIGEVVERIGHLGFMFPTHALADPTYGGALRCYMDPEIGVFNNAFFADCDFTTSTSEPRLTKPRIFPNPTSTEIQFIDIENVRMIYLLDISGNVVYGEKHGASIDVSGLPQGMYLVQFEFLTGVVALTKFVKN